jgi:acyl-CoA synthetase (AMP-forming)/AMP-acid ligase II
MDRGYATVGRALRVSAANYPGKTAVMEVGRGSLTYAELNATVNRLAHHLLAKGVSKGDNVGIVMLNSTEHIALLYALAKIGAVSVAIDPHWTPHEVARVVSHFDCHLVCVDVHLLSKLDDVKEQATPKGRILFDGQAPLLESLGKDINARPDHEPDVTVLDYDVFTLVLTSGTTGMPKGCMRTHRNVEMGCLKDALGKHLNNTSRELIVAPIYYGTARGSVIGQIYVGGTIHVMPKFDERVVTEHIRTHEITDISLAPTMIHRMLKLEGLQRDDFKSIRSLRKVGSPFTKKMVEEIRAKITTNIFQGFASTESGGVTMLKPEDQLRKPGSSGLPRWGVEIQIVGPDEKPLPRGEVGEIRVSGANVCEGYYKNKEEQDKVFRNGWYYTGDLGWLDPDNYLYVVGRAKNMIKTGSINVAPAEIEGAILEISDVDDCAVFGVPDEEWGEAIKAAIVLKGPAAISAEDVKAHCRKSLAGFKIPKSIVFVETITRNPTGKVATEFIDFHRKN